MQLASKFWELLHVCESNNVNIHAVVADGMSVNRKFFKLISGVKHIPMDDVFVAPNPYTENDIFLCSDPSHLLKVL